VDKDANQVPCQISQAGIDFIARFEGYRATPYNDVAGNATVGFGHKIQEGETFDKPLTREEALALLAKDVSEKVLPSLDAVRVELAQNQADALGSFIFNVGSGAFGGSTLLRQLNAGDFASVPSQLLRWNMAGGRVVPELTQRRQAEGRLWSSGRP